jgi:GNAT superfamily N-acetyltransferase
MSVVFADKYHVRLARPSEIAGLPVLETRAARLFVDWLDEAGLTLEMLERVSSLEKLTAAQQRGHVWVAVSSSGEVVGFAQVVILNDLAHLDELDVLPEHGQRGVGTQLLDAVCEWARRAGYPKVTLSTFRHVPWNRPFYERRGFTTVDEGQLPPEHLKLIESERARGLKTELRVIMERLIRHD